MSMSYEINRRLDDYEKQVAERQRRELEQKIQNSKAENLASLNYRKSELYNSLVSSTNAEHELKNNIDAKIKNIEKQTLNNDICKKLVKNQVDCNHVYTQINDLNRNLKDNYKILEEKINLYESLVNSSNDLNQLRNFQNDISKLNVNLNSLVIITKYQIEKDLEYERMKIENARIIESLLKELSSMNQLNDFPELKFIIIDIEKKAKEVDLNSISPFIAQVKNAKSKIGKIAREKKDNRIKNSISSLESLINGSLGTIEINSPIRKLENNKMVFIEKQNEFNDINCSFGIVTSEGIKRKKEQIESDFAVIATYQNIQKKDIDKMDELIHDLKMLEKKNEELYKNKRVIEDLVDKINDLIDKIGDKDQKKFPYSYPENDFLEYKRLLEDKIIFFKDKYENKLLEENLSIADKKCPCEKGYALITKKTLSVSSPQNDYLMYRYVYSNADNPSVLSVVDIIRNKDMIEVLVRDFPVILKVKDKVGDDRFFFEDYSESLVKKINHKCKNKKYDAENRGYFKYMLLEGSDIKKYIKNITGSDVEKFYGKSMDEIVSRYIDFNSDHENKENEDSFSDIQFGGGISMHKTINENIFERTETSSSTSIDMKELEQKN